jgi:hypothetical protein
MSSLAGSSGVSSLDPLVVFEVAASGVPASLEPALALPGEVAALLKVRIIHCYACIKPASII